MVNEHGIFSLLHRKMDGNSLEGCGSNAGKWNRVDDHHDGHVFILSDQFYVTVLPL